MVLQNEDAVKVNIHFLKKELEDLYDEKKDIQRERIQILSQELDRLINILLKQSLKNGDTREICD